MIKRFLAFLAPVLAVFVLLTASPAAASGPSYFFNPIPVINGWQYGWSLSGTSTYNRTIPATAGPCTNCYAYLYVHWTNGTNSWLQAFGGQNYVTINHNGRAFSWANHEVKFKAANGLCYVQGRQINSAGNYSAVWGPTQVGC